MLIIIGYLLVFILIIIAVIVAFIYFIFKRIKEKKAERDILNNDKL